MKTGLLIILVCVSVLAVLFTGCGKIVSTDYTEPLEALNDVPDVPGSALCDGMIEMQLTSDIDENVITEDILITNTTEINVSISRLKGDEEVAVYLYDAEYMDNCIAVTTLSANQRRFSFRNLKSTVGYRIGAKPEKLVENKILKITD